MRFSRSIRSSETEAAVRSRIAQYLRAIGYKQRASDPFIILERNAGLGPLAGGTTRRWPSRAIVEIRPGEAGVTHATVVVDIYNSGAALSAEARAAFEHELDGLATVVGGADETPVATEAPASAVPLPGLPEAASARMEPQRAVLDPERLLLMARLKSGMSWFYWIAGLSVINSIGSLIGSTFSFVVGLGFTQAVDQLTVELGRRAPAGATAFRVAGASVDLLIAGLFVFFGWNAIRRRSWAFRVGIVLYILDAALFLLVKDYFAVGFHAFALYGLFRGLFAHRRLAQLEQGQRPGGPNGSTSAG